MFNMFKMSFCLVFFFLILFMLIFLLLRFSDHQPQTIYFNVIVSSNSMKWNKKKFVDGIHVFYKDIANLPTLDIME